MCGKLLSIRVCNVRKFVQVPSSALVKSIGNLNYIRFCYFISLGKILGIIEIILSVMMFLFRTSSQVAFIVGGFETVLRLADGINDTCDCRHNFSLIIY